MFRYFILLSGLVVLVGTGLAEEPLVPKVSFSKATYAVDKDYANAVTVVVTRDGEPVPDKEVQLEALSGLASIATAKIKTNDKGIALFGFKAGSDVGDEIVVRATVTEGGKTGTMGGARLIAKEIRKFKVEASFGSVQYSPGVGATLDVTVTPEDDGPKAGIEVVARVTKSKSKVKASKLTTDSEGKVTFSITTDSEPGDLIVLVTLNVEDGPAPVTPRTSIVSHADGLGSTRVRTDFIVGTTFHNDYESEGKDKGKSKGFGAVSRFMELNFDTLWRQTKSRHHLGVNVRLSSFPESSTIPDSTNTATEDDDTIANKAANDEVVFTGYDDSIGGTLFYDFEHDKWCSKSETNKNPDKPFDYFRFGGRIMADFISRQNLDVNQDSLIRSLGAGIIFTHYRSTAADKNNETPLGFISISGNHFEDYSGVENEWRMLITAATRLNVIGGSDGLPFNLGIHANVGEGPDDLRIFAGFRFGLNKLVGIFQ